MGSPVPASWNLQILLVWNQAGGLGSSCSKGTRAEGREERERERGQFGMRGRIGWGIVLFEGFIGME